MNRIYRLIFSKTALNWIPVAECTRACKKKSGHTAAAGITKAIASTLMSMAVIPCAIAAPDGGQITGGTGSITASGTSTTIRQLSQNLSLNWQNFNVGAQETVNFIQPSAAAVAVNRITGGNPSQILGQINANGKLFLINPAGLLFGQTAQINVGSLVASTLDLASDSTASSLRFRGDSSAAVTNLGAITAANGGFVALLGSQVSNQGIISAKMGTVALASGNAITLNFQNDSLINVQVDSSSLNGVARNNGLIVADGGQVIMTAGARDALYASTVSNDGVIEAQTLENHQGTILLSASDSGGEVHVAGKLDATAPEGGKGGLITVSAPVVRLNGATLDASGADGGGTILVGGGAQGAALAGMVNAEMMSVDAGSRVRADGGDGTVVLWSNQNTDFGGTINAAGGWVETSSHGVLNLGNAAMVHASDWLLDPTDVTITTAANSNETVSSGTYTPTTGSTTSNIQASTINSALAGGTSVTITTASSGTGTGNITQAVGANISTAGTASLTMNATNNIIINGDIAMGTGTLTLNAIGGAVSGSGNFSSSGVMNFKPNLASASGTISGLISGTGSVLVNGGGTLVLTAANTYTGATTVNNATLTLHGNNVLSSSTAVGIGNNGTLLLDTNNIWGAPSGTVNNPLITVNSGGVLSSNNTFNQINNLTLAGGTLVNNGGMNSTYQSFGLGGTVTVTASSNINTGTGNGKNGINLGNAASSTTTFNISSGAILKTGRMFADNPDFGASSLIIIGGGTLQTGGVNIYTGSTTISNGFLNLTGTGVLGNGSYAGTISIGSGSALTLSGVISGAGALTKDTSASVLGLNAANTYTGATTINAGTVALLAGFSLANGTAVAINNGGTLRLDYSNIWGNSESNVVNPAISVNAGGTLASNNSFNQINDLTLNGGQLLSNGGVLFSYQSFGLGGTVHVTANSSIVAGSTGNGANAVNLGKLGLMTTTFNVDPGMTLNVSNSLWNNASSSPATGLTLTGGGTMVLNNSNVYTGNTTINAGTLQLAGGGLLNAGNYTGNIAVASGATFRYSSTLDQILSGAISGAGTVIKDTGATSVLSLHAANTYTGATTVNAGTLALQAANSLSTGTNVAIYNGGTLRLDKTDIWGPAISNVTTPSITVNSGGVLASNNTFNQINSLTLNGGSVIANGGYLAAFQAFDFGGTVNVTASSTIMSGGAGNGLNAINLGKNGNLVTTFNINSGTTLTSNAIWRNSGDFGAAGITVTGGGTLLLTGTNTYTGSTTVSAGSLIVGSGGSLGAGSYAGAISLASGALLDYASSANQTLSGIISGAGALTKDTSSTSVLTLGGASTYTGNTTVNAGTLQITGSGKLGGGSYAGAMALATGTNFKYSSSANQTLSGVISGGGALTKDTSTSSVLTLAAGNTYTGATTINAGTLALNAGSALSTGTSAIVNSGGTLRLDRTNIWGSANNLFATPSITVNAGGVLASNNTFNQINSLTLNGGTVIANGGAGVPFQAFDFGGTVNVTASSAMQSGGTGNGYNAINLGRNGLATTTFNISSGATLTVGNTLQDNGDFGAANIAVTGGGTLLLTNNNTYTGTTTVNASTFKLGNAGMLGYGAYAGNIALSSGALFDDASSANQTLSGVISGAGALVKDTSGTSVLTLTGSNTWTGATTVNAGIIALNGDMATSTTTPITINSGGTLRLDRSNIWGLSANMMNSPPITVNAGGVLASNNTFNMINSLTLNGGSVAANGGSSSTFQAFGFGGTVNVTADSTIQKGVTGNGLTRIYLGQNGNLTTTFNIAAGKTLTIDNAIANNSDFGGGALALSGGGTLVLNGSNTYTGATNLSAGTLVIGSNGSLRTGNYAGAISLASGTLFDYASSAGQVLSGVISGADSLTKEANSASALTLAGANTYQGTTTVNAGILNLAGSWTPAGGTATTVIGAGAYLSGNGVINANTLQTSGAGTMSLNGANLVGTLSASGTVGDIILYNSQSLALGPLASSGTLSLIASGANSDLTLNAGTVVSSTASGNAITFSAGRNFINNGGMGAVSAANGNWQIYSTTPAADTFGNLDSANTAVWDSTWSAAMPNVSQSGNRYVFSYSPSLTVTSQDTTKIYGADAGTTVAAAYTITGLQSGVAGVYLADSASNVYSGTPVVTSTGSAAGNAVGNYAETVAIGSLAPLSGYTINPVSSGVLTVSRAPLLVTANSASKDYDGTPWSGGDGVTYSGFVNGDNAAALSGTLGYAGNSQGAVAPGTYDLLATGQTSGNYMIHYQPGQLTIRNGLNDSRTTTAARPSAEYSELLDAAQSPVTAQAKVAVTTQMVPVRAECRESSLPAVQNGAISGPLQSECRSER